MKSIKTAVLGVMSLAAGATMAHATTEIYFTGSTAFRGATVDAIHNIFDSSPAVTFGYTGTTETKQDAGVYSGKIGGVAYIIKTFWTGSEAGIQAVATTNGVGTGLQLNFPNDTPDVGGVETALTATGLQNIDDPTSETIAHPDVEVPQIDMSDTFQASGEFATTNTQIWTDSSTHTCANLHTQLVGVVPFVFVVSRSGSATVTNIDDEQVKNLFTNGYLPRAVLSGVHADETKRVYATGRNPDSGTRVTTLVDTGIGNATSIKQYEPVDNTGALITAVNATVATIQPWPVDTVNSILISQYDSGYNSGGKLAGALGSVTTSMVLSGTTTTGGDLLTYLSTSDAATATGGGAAILSYNGVPESNTTVEEGQYTFWSYEHLNYISPFTYSSIASSIASLISNTYASYSGIPISSLNVERHGYPNTNSDGAAIIPLYSY